MPFTLETAVSPPAFKKGTSVRGHDGVAGTFIEVRISPNRGLEHFRKVIPVLGEIVVRL